ncbi:RND transporter [Desulfocarbo indianensis]|nr:RND transporter [Desulfocarbo indianensis]
MIRLFRKASFPACLAAALALAAALPFAGCKGDKGYAPPPPPTVTVSRPVEKAVTVWAEYTGNTKAFEAVEIRARVEGFLESINFTPSSRVKKGDLLFVIEPKPYQAQLDEALADLSIKKAELQLADATLIRKENAYKDRAVSEVDVIQARAEKAKAEASIKAAEAAVVSARVNLSYTSIRSPVRGMVSRNLVDAGNLVGRSEATLLTTVVNDDPMYVYFNISEANLLEFLSRKKGRFAEGPHDDDRNRVHLGLANEKGYPHQGQLDYVDNRIDPQTGTIQLRGRFANPEGRLIPGLFARVRIPIGRLDQAVLVPEVSLASDQGGRYVLVVNDKSEVEHRRVKLGPLEEDLRVVLEGVGPGDKVIVKGLQRVRPGMKVNAITVEEAKTQAEQAQAAQKQPAKKDK